MSVRPGSSRARGWVAAIAVAGFIAAVAAPGSAASSFSGLKQSDGLVRLSQRELLSNAVAKLEPGEGGEARSEILDAAESFAAPRNLPAEFGDADVGAARLAAVEAAGRLPVVGGNWNEITDLPYDSDDAITLAEQVFGKVGAVLAGNTGDQRGGHAASPSDL